MTVAIILTWIFGWQTGELMVKRELIKDGAYFCRSTQTEKRCYDVKVVEDAYAREDLKQRTN